MAKLHSGKAILINPGDFHVNTDKWDVVVQGELDLTYKVSSLVKKFLFQVKKFISYKRFLKKVSKKLTFDESYDMYYCNLDDVLTNHLYQKLISNNSNRFIVVEDGILNYYHPKRDLKVLYRKKFFSSLLSIDFEIFTNHPTNVESERIVKQYVRLPEKAIAAAKSVKLPYKSISYQELEDVLLIIGQDIMHNTSLGEEYYIERVKKLFSNIVQLEGKKKRVIYKPHRNGNIELAKNILFQTFSNHEVLMDITPIEELIEAISPKSIYSFESSAMLNLKLSLKNDKVKMGVLSFYEHDTSLISLYRELGIKILK